MRGLLLPCVLSSAVIFASACSKEQPVSTAPKVESLAAIELPAAVPAEAAGVLVVRSSESLFMAIAAMELLGAQDPANIEAMRSELDTLMRDRLGVTLTAADRATAFFLPDEGVAVVLEGVEGSLRGQAAGKVHGVALYTVEGATVAMHRGELVVGERGAVERAITVATGQRASLRDSSRPLRDVLVQRSEGAHMVAAVDVAALPPELRGQVEGLGVEQATLSYGSAGIRAAAYGRPEALESLRAEVVKNLERVGEANDRAYEEARRGDGVWSAMPAIVAHYQWKHVHGLLSPVLEGRRLSLEVPVQLDDPMLVTAFAGVAAAIAIPALTKYMRRSKTAEARVGIAHMFDSVAVFFNEERIRDGKLTQVDPAEAATFHRCPSDGRLIGEAGPTPPLSLRCGEGPNGMCVPVQGEPRGPGEYSVDLWHDDPVWRELNFVRDQPHAFHYGLRWANDPRGFGNCMFTAQAFGDLDDDGLFSTYERAGAADRNGLNAAAGLYIDQEVE